MVICFCTGNPQLSSADGAPDAADMHNYQTTAAKLERPSSACERRRKKIPKEWVPSVLAHLVGVMRVGVMRGTKILREHLPPKALHRESLQLEHVRQHPIQSFVPPIHENGRLLGTPQCCFSCTTSSWPRDSCGREKLCEISPSPRAKKATSLHRLRISSSYSQEDGRSQGPARPKERRAQWPERRWSASCASAPRSDVFCGRPPRPRRWPREKPDRPSDAHELVDHLGITTDEHRHKYSVALHLVIHQQVDDHTKEVGPKWSARNLPRSQRQHSETMGRASSACARRRDKLRRGAGVRASWHWPTGWRSRHPRALPKSHDARRGHSDFSTHLTPSCATGAFQEVKKLPSLLCSTLRRPQFVQADVLQPFLAVV